jgi:two-component system, cell cycle sensor histidine kinase PleC
MIQNKYIIRLSFVVLFFNILANMVLYRYFMIEDIILKQVAIQNAKISEIFQKRIWDSHTLGVTKLKQADNYKNLFYLLKIQSIFLKI